MGSFYTNIILYKASQKQVADLLAAQKRTAYVSPTVNNFTVVYDRKTEDQDARVLKVLAEALTRQFQCSGMASLVHDSDVYLYWLYENGKLLDSYNSMPSYFDAENDDPTPQGGDVQKLCQAFDRSDAPDKLAHLFALVEQSNLGSEGATYMMAEDIHARLVSILGIPSFAAFIGYNYIESGDVSDDLKPGEVIKV